MTNKKESDSPAAIEEEMKITFGSVKHNPEPAQ